MTFYANLAVSLGGLQRTRFIGVAHASDFDCGTVLLLH